MRKRNRAVLLRFTDDEITAVDDAAAQCGLSRQDWVRLTLLWAAGQRKTRPLP